MKLTHKIFIIYSLFYIITSFLAIWIVYDNMYNEAIKDAREKSEILLNRTYAINKYISNELRPAVFKRLKMMKVDKDYFDPRWMSASYINRGVDRYYQERTKGNYIYKRFTVNARSIESEADEFEQEIFHKMSDDKDLELLTSIRDIDGKLFYTVMKKNPYFSKGCMKCHSQPEKAPSDLIKLYDNKRGFHKSLGDLSGVISIKIPLNEPLTKAKGMTFKLTALLLSLYFGSTLLMFIYFRKNVIKPIADVGDAMDSISQDETLLGTQIAKQNSEEMNTVSQAFNRMSLSLKGIQDNLYELVDEKTDALNKSKSQLETILSDQQELLCRTDKLGNILYANQSFTGYFNLEKLNVVHNIFMLMASENSEDLNSMVSVLKPEVDTVTMDSMRTLDSGKQVWLQWSIRGFFAEEQLQEIQLLGLDVTDKVLKEQVAREALKEKEMLMSEMNHRIKNNLSLISSMLGLKSIENEDPEIQKIMKDMQSRIETVGALHQMLYISNEYKEIQLDDYLRQIVSNIRESMKVSHIALMTELSEITLPTKNVLTIGLIVTELITNSIKYAFLDRDDASINVDGIKTEDGCYQLMIKDNGIGLDESQTEDGTGFGMQMVNILVDQLNASMTVSNENGVTFIITIPIAKDEN